MSRRKSKGIIHFMEEITKESPRVIVSDFAADIERTKTLGPKPETTIINFRNQKRDKIESRVYSVPIELLRFRKENGRIASDVSSYEKEHGVIIENDAEGQKVLAGFLKSKDPDQTDILKKSVMQTGQDEPAIITCDGFLINGNRRRLVLGMLLEETNKAEFSRMKVVILPGESGEGGPPTIKEIEQIENRYQSHKDGKSEYSRFDKALSTRRKMGLGLSLEELLRDDPVHSGKTPIELKKEIKKYQEEYLEPLECADRYLASIGREGMYNLISSNVGGKENRWEAFIDYSKLYRKLNNSTERAKLGVEENDVAKIEAAVFNLIRVRDFSNIGMKLHMLVRDIPKYLKHDLGKKEIFSISRLPEVEVEKAQTAEDADKKWIKKNHTQTVKSVLKAKEYYDHKDDQEKPIVLLKQALDKLNHARMDSENVGIGDLTEAIVIAEDIRNRADELKREFYSHQKKLQNLVNKNSR